MPQVQSHVLAKSAAVASVPLWFSLVSAPNENIFFPTMSRVSLNSETPSPTEEKMEKYSVTLEKKFCPVQFH